MNIRNHQKLRTDTTAIESDIRHPTDAMLLQDGIKVITRMTHNLERVANMLTKTTR